MNNSDPLPVKTRQTKNAWIGDRLVARDENTDVLRAEAMIRFRAPFNRLYCVDCIESSASIARCQETHLSVLGHALCLYRLRPVASHP